MSAKDNKPQLTSGSQRFTPAEFKTRMLLIRKNAFLNAWSVVISRVVNSRVAKKTSKMRNELRAAGVEQIEKIWQRVNAEFSIRALKLEHIKDVEYARYHWEKSPIGLDFYIKPTTPNTFPIKSAEIGRILGLEMTREFNKELRKAGFEVKK